MTRAELVHRVREASEEARAITDEEVVAFFPQPEQERPEWLKRYEAMVVEDAALRKAGVR